VCATDYRVNGKRSLDRAERNVSHLRTYFAGWKAVSISTPSIRTYIDRRQKAPKTGPLTASWRHSAHVLPCPPSREAPTPTVHPSRHRGLAPFRYPEGCEKRECSEKPWAQLRAQATGPASGQSLFGVPGRRSDAATTINLATPKRKFAKGSKNDGGLEGEGWQLARRHS